MSTCIRCHRHYREPADEQGDHDCPGCGLRPEDRSRYTHASLKPHRNGRWVDEMEDENIYYCYKVDRNPSS